MSLPVLILTRRLLVGGLSASVGPPPPPTVPHYGIQSSFASVATDPVNTVSATFTVYKTSPVDTQTTLVWTLVPDAVNGITSGYLTDATVLAGVTLTFPVGVDHVDVSVGFAAHARPSVDLGGSVVLSSPSGTGILDASVTSFPFTVPAQVIQAQGAWDLGPDYTLNWAFQQGASSVTLTQIGDGVVLDPGTSQANQNNAAWMWNKNPLPTGAWKLTFSFTKLDALLASQGNGVFAQIYPGYTGGLVSSDSSPFNWTSSQYADSAFTAGGVGKCSKAAADKYGTKGIRASFAQDALTLTNSNQLRSHNIDGAGSEGNLGGTTYGAAFSFATGTEYAMEVSYYPSTSLMRWKQTDPSGTAVTVDVLDANVAVAIGQYLGIGTSAARKCQWRALSVVSIVDDGGAIGGSGAYRDDATQWPTKATLDALPATTVNSGNISTILANTAAGHRYVIGADITAGTTSIVVDGVGTFANPIVIEGDLTAPANFRQLKLKRITVQNGAYITFRYLDLADTLFDILGTSHHITMERFQMYGRTGGLDGDGPPISIGARGNQNDPLRWLRFRYFQYGKAGVTTSSNMFRFHGAPQTNYTFPNHARYIKIYNGLVTNISRNVTPMCIVGMWGDNDRDVERDIQMGIYNLLITECHGDKPMNIVEIKTAGSTVANCTYERGSANQAAYWKNRHGKNDFLNLLFIRRTGTTGGNGQSGITLRDTGCRAYNCHAYTLDDGVQPTINSPAGHPSDKVTLFTGYLDASLYNKNSGHPPNSFGDGVQGHMEMNAYQCKVGGCNMEVLVGDDNTGNAVALPPTGASIHACYNIVGPDNNVGRKDRNKKVTIALDRDFHGRGKYRLASTATEAGDPPSTVYSGPPAYGTLITGSTTDFGTSLVADGADITQVPHRVLAAEVGPGAP